MEFLILIVLIVTVIWLMKFILRKAFNIPKVKRKVFSYNHINKAHRNADWALRIIGLIFYLVVSYKLIYDGLSINLFLLIITLLLTAENFLRAYFEWKASEHPKESILSIAEGVTLIGIVLVLIQFNVLNKLAQ